MSNDLQSRIDTLLGDLNDLNKTIGDLLLYYDKLEARADELEDNIADLEDTLRIIADCKTLYNVPSPEAVMARNALMVSKL